MTWNPEQNPRLVLRQGERCDSRGRSVLTTNKEGTKEQLASRVFFMKILQLPDLPTHSTKQRTSSFQHGRTG